MRPRHLHRMPALGYIFLRIGVAAFGGLGASLALIERELVTNREAAHRRRGHRRPDLYQTAAGVHRSAGRRLSWLHAWRLVRLAVATAAFLLPAALMMLGLAAAYVSVTAVPTIRPGAHRPDGGHRRRLAGDDVPDGQGDYAGSPHPGDCARLHASRGGPRHQRGGDFRAGRTGGGRSVRAPALAAGGRRTRHDPRPVHPLRAYSLLVSEGRGGAAADRADRGGRDRVGQWQDFATAVASATSRPVLCS